jgi:TonB-linked SusC/RagA family outer membrane protein
MRKIFLLFSVLLMFTITVQAQNRTITGTVTSKDDNGPLVGVTIQVKGSQTATATDANGNYSIKVTNLQNVVIGAKFLGFDYQEVTLKPGEKVLNFKLTTSTNNLDEVVVVGYGTQRKATLTGAVTTISTKDIEDIPSLNLAASLAGQAAGVGVTQDQRPGQQASITIRNPVVLNASAGGTTSPLYIIDDIVRTQGDFNLLDPNDIESISVLKDAEAAIYGVAGGSGAILIRTKKGKIGAPKINFSSQFGTANAVMLPKMLSGPQLATFINDYQQIGEMAPNGTPTGDTIDVNGYVNHNASQKIAGWYTPDELAYINNPANNSNFLKQEFQAADVEREAINISGGTEKATYFIGADYVNQNSNFAGISNYKWGVRANVQSKPAKGLTVGLNISYDQSYNKEFWYKQKSTTESINNDVVTLNQALPWQKYFINGNPAYLSSTTFDDINVMLFQNSNNYEDDPQYLTNFLGTIGYEIPGIKGLSANATFNYNINTNFPTQFGTGFNYYQYSGTGSNDHIPGGTFIKTIEIDNGNIITFNPSYVRTYQLDASLNYQKSIGKNNITALALYEQREGYSDFVNANSAGVVPGGLPNFNFTTGLQQTNQANGSLLGETGVESVVERINYDYNQTYLLQLVGRQDGTTNFAPGLRWGNFGEVSVGWVASNEKFVKDLTPWMDQLKFRGSLGLLGGNGLGTSSYQYYQQYNIATGSPNGGAVFDEQIRGTGIKSAALADPYTTWDHKTETDYGVDMQFLKSRLSVTGDYFWTHGYQLLTTLQSSVPFLIGNTPPAENYGIVNNFGTEITVGWADHINKDWGYNVKVFYSWSDDKNIREDISPGLIGTVQDRTGKSDDGGVFGYQSLGIIRTQAQANEIIAERAAAAGGAQNVKIFGYTPAPGMLNYADLNGDGIIESADTKDEKYLTPKSSNHNNVGFNFGFSYKTLSFNVVSGLSWGGTASIPATEQTADDNQSSSNGGGDLQENRAAFWSNHWTPTNTNAAYPAPYYYKEWDVTSNFWFVNSFNWNIQQANMSWTLPQKWIKIVGLANARIFGQCTNVLSLYNPYPDQYRTTQVNIENYPLLRTFTFGLNAGF